MHSYLSQKSHANLTLLLLVFLVLIGVSDVNATESDAFYASYDQSSNMIKFTTATNEPNTITIYSNKIAPQQTIAPTAISVVNPVIDEGIGTPSTGSVTPQEPTSEQDSSGSQGTSPEPVDNTAAITSPNGMYSVSVADNGIFLKGPSGSIVLGASNILINGINIKLEGLGLTKINGTNLEMAGAAITKINGSLIIFNNGDKPIAGQGDGVVVANPYGSQGQIITGSPNIMVP